MLARWSGWGSLPQVFDEANDAYAAAREQARRLLGDEAAWTAARRTTLNAHYTPAEVAAAMWRVVGDLGFAGGRVLEPGCGSGKRAGPGKDGIVYFDEASIDAYLERHGSGVVAVPSTGSSTGSSETSPDTGTPASTSKSRKRSPEAQSDTGEHGPAAHNPKVAGSNPAPATKG